MPFIARIKRILKKLSCFHDGNEEAAKPIIIGAPTNFQRVYTELDLQYGFLKESHAAAAQAAVEDFAAINPASSNTLALEEQPTTIGYAGSNDDITLAGGSDVEKH